jgi:hypothetical protein
MSGMVRVRGKVRGEWGWKPGAMNYVVPSWADLEFFVVAEDGSETPLTGVRSVKFEAREGSAPLTATLECYVDEVDVVARAVEPPFFVKYRIAGYPQTVAGPYPTREIAEQHEKDIRGFEGVIFSRVCQVSP